MGQCDKREGPARAPEVLLVPEAALMTCTGSLGCGHCACAVRTRARRGRGEAPSVFNWIIPGASSGLISKAAWSPAQINDCSLIRTDPVIGRTSWVIVFVPGNDIERGPEEEAPCTVGPAALDPLRLSSSVPTSAWDFPRRSYSVAWAISRAGGPVLANLVVSFPATATQRRAERVRLTQRSLSLLPSISSLPL